MERIDWETVASYQTNLEANIAKARLEDEGIRVFIENSMMADMAWHLNNATGGARVQVPRADAARAAAILAGAKGAAEREGAEDEESWADEETENLTEVDRAFQAAVLGLVVVPLGAYAWWLLLKALGTGSFGEKPGKALVTLVLTAPMFILTLVFLRIFAG